MKNLTGKNAILTGGAYGVGLHIARAMAKEGINIALAARNVENLEAAKAELSTYGTTIVAIPTDVTKADSRDSLVKQAIDEFGHIDILVNNAGLGVWTEFVKQEDDQIMQMVDTNFTGPMLLAQKVLAGMLERGAGHIVNMGSLSGKKGHPYLSVYSGTKIALMEWSDALRGELEGSGVDVSLVSPTYVSEAGMFQRLGMSAPALIGSVSADKVAKAVVRSLKTNNQEIIVSPIPIRPLLVVNSISPGVGSWLLKKTGVIALCRKLVKRQAEYKA